MIFGDIISNILERADLRHVRGSPGYVDPRSKQTAPGSEAHRLTGQLSNELGVPYDPASPIQPLYPAPIPILYDETQPSNPTTQPQPTRQPSPSPGAAFDSVMPQQPIVADPWQGLMANGFQPQTQSQPQQPNMSQRTQQQPSRPQTRTASQTRTQTQQMPFSRDMFFNSFMSLLLDLISRTR